jgi:hypothetical protein
MVLFNWARPTMPVRPARLGVPGPLGLSAQGRGAEELAPMAPRWLRRPIFGESAARGGGGGGREAPRGLEDSILGVMGRSISSEQSLPWWHGLASGERR